MEAEREQRRVLIIDEEGSFSRSLSVYLSDLGLHTLTANLWTEALDRILDDRPNAILINPHLATVQGETILKFLREEGNRTPVVVVSDRLEAERVAALRSMGANDFVQKADAFYQIAQALSKVLPGWSAEKAPVITEDEFERIMDQRFMELMEETEKEKKPRGGREPGFPSQGPPPESESAARRRPEASPEFSQAPVSLPPPPLSPEEPARQRARVRRKRTRPGSGWKRVFTFLFVVCLLAGVVFMALTMGITEFVKGGGEATEAQR